MKPTIPICEKENLTIPEASAYFGIGTTKLRKMVQEPRCAFVLWVGRKCLIKRKKLEDYLNKQYSI